MPLPAGDDLSNAEGQHAYINKYIRNTPLEAFQQQRMNNLLHALVDTSGSGGPTEGGLKEGYIDATT